MTKVNEQKYNILYIDDEETNLQSFKAAFRRDYKVFTSNSAAEAIKIMRAQEIGVVLTDNRMPGVTGVDFLTSIIHEFPDTVRIVVSGYSDADAIVKSINEAYVFRYITKPWNEEDLKKTIDLAFKVYEIQRNRDNLIKKMQDEHNRQTRILNIFKKYVPMYLVDEVPSQKNEEDTLFDGELMKISVFFIKIRDLSSILIDKEAESIIAFLNGYLSMVTSCVKEHHGSIDKFIGGVIMAIFGAPNFSVHNAKNAVFSALEILDRLEEFNEKFKDKLKKPLEVDISICFGETIVGNLGSPDCLSYTAVGDTVNTAARMLELNKIYPNSNPVKINTLIYEQVSNSVVASFLGNQQIRGKEKPIDIYQVTHRKI